MTAASTRADEDYERYRPAVLRFLAARYPRLDEEAREEVCQDAFVALLHAKSCETRIESAEGYLIRCARNGANRHLSCADARRRVSLEPCAYEAIPDHSASPEEEAISADESQQVRRLVECLPRREQEVLQLRFALGLEVPEIRVHLGLSVSQYRRLAKRASAALARAFREVDHGEWSKRQRSLLCACLLGVASSRQQQAARKLLKDPHCRALLLELRGFGRKAAATLPVPTVEHADPGVLGRALDRAADGLASLKQPAADAAAQLKQHASAGYFRALDPTPLSGVRPGAAATVIAGCLALGGGATYCASEGIQPLDELAGVVTPAAEKKKPDPPADPPDSSEPPAPSPRAPEPERRSEPEPRSQPEPPPATPAPAPAATPAPPPPVVPEREFEPLRPSGSSAQKPSPRPAVPKPAPSAGTGEFDGP